MAARFRCARARSRRRRRSRRSTSTSIRVSGESAAAQRRAPARRFFDVGAGPEAALRWRPDSAALARDPGVVAARGGAPRPLSAFLEKAPRPNAARLLVDFLMSEPGQKLLYDGGQIPLRSRAIPASSPLAAEHLDLYPRFWRKRRGPTPRACSSIF